jgi:hypothetical protein
LETKAAAFEMPQAHKRQIMTVDKFIPLLVILCGLWLLLNNERRFVGTPLCDVFLD